MVEMKIEFGERYKESQWYDLDEYIKAKDLTCKIFMTYWGWKLGVVLPKSKIHFLWHV
jgi:hypothetical protein